MLKSLLLSHSYHTIKFSVNYTQESAMNSLKFNKTGVYQLYIVG